MTNIQERELLRARWQRSLLTFALDSEAREDFAVSGLAMRLTDVTVQVLLMPADPEADAFPIGETTHQWISEIDAINLDAMRFKLPGEAHRSAHALVLSHRYNDDRWSSYVAVHRSGAVEWGLGADGGWTRETRDAVPIRRIALSPTVARVWATLRLASMVQTSYAIAGPYNLVVGIRGTYQAELGSLGEGWAEPGDFQNRVRPCPERHLLWQIEIEELPDEEVARQIAYSIGDRIEDAWGVKQRRYLAERGPYQGKLDPRRC
ncbi:MAG: hypothetical protein Q7L55_02595 [Actinomycetota bacterium]|nr:hypothetical protein [Actinomycetota bacterium]